VASEFIVCWLEFVKILIFITVDIYIQTHCQKNKKIKRADQILPEVYGNTLNDVLLLKLRFSSLRHSDLRRFGDPV